MLVIKNLRSDDNPQLERIKKFLRDNPDEGIRERPKDQIELAQRTGLVLYVENDAGIRGCSFIYKFSQSQIVYSEIGTMRVIENGFRLQQMLSQVHIIQMRYEEYYGVANEVFAVVRPGTGSEHRLKKYTLMQDWDPPPILIHLRTQGGVSFSSEKYCLNANDICNKKAITDLAELYSGNNMFRVPNGDEQVRFDLGWFHDGLLTMVP